MMHLPSSASFVQAIRPDLRNVAKADSSVQDEPSVPGPEAAGLQTNVSIGRDGRPYAVPNVRTSSTAPREEIKRRP